MERQDLEFCLRVLGYRDSEDNSQWIAHGLEMDLVAYGETFDSACEALKVLVLSQISFALFKGNLDLLWHPAHVLDDTGSAFESADV